MTDRHRATDPRHDDDPEVPEPIGPEPREPGNRTLSSPVNELESRLFGQRKVPR